MESFPEQLYSQRIVSSDFDEFREVVRGWDLDFLQLDFGPFKADVLQVGKGQSQLTKAEFGRALKQQGNPPPGVRTFAIPLLSSSPFFWRGYSVSPNTMMVFSEDTELYAVSKANFHVYTISFSEKHLLSCAEDYGAQAVDEVLAKFDAFEVSPERISALRAVAEEIVSLFSFLNTAEGERRVSILLEEELPRALISALSSDIKCTPSLPSRKRERALTLAEEYVQEYKTRPIALSELCRETQVSERTLRNAFVERYGISPADYIKAIRLDGVRKSLKCSDPLSSSVARISQKWGFSHSGQFAKDYYKMFRELPSQSLAKKATGLAQSDL